MPTGAIPMPGVSCRLIAADVELPGCPTSPMASLPVCSKALLSSLFPSILCDSLSYSQSEVSKAYLFSPRHVPRGPTAPVHAHIM